MERQLFDWQGWSVGPEGMIFHNPVLKIPMKAYPVGTKFTNAIIMWNKGILEFYNDNSEAVLTCKLKLVIID